MVCSFSRMYAPDWAAFKWTTEVVFEKTEILFWQLAQFYPALERPWEPSVTVYTFGYHCI